jgi:hypothetical protein
VFLSRRRRLSLGALISDLPPQVLPLLPLKPSCGVVDLDLVNQLRDEEC